MKKVLLGILIGAAAVYGYNHLHQPAVAATGGRIGEEVEDSAAGSVGPAAAEVREKFQCDGRTYCSQMTSCDEAIYFLKNCPGVKMDGEGDGIPCEGQWCGHH